MFHFQSINLYLDTDASPVFSVWNEMQPAFEIVSAILFPKNLGMIKQALP